MTMVEEIAKQVKINPNQNLLSLIVSFGALGAAEYYHVRFLLCFSFVASTIMVFSIAATTISYTTNYCGKKSSGKQQQGQ